MTPEQSRFNELLRKPGELSDEDLREMVSLMPHDPRSHIQGMAQIRANLETIAAIRRFDIASGKLVERGNRINAWVLVFAVILQF